MNELCAILLSWAITLSDYPPQPDCPEIVPVSHEWLFDKACGTDCVIYGLYPGHGDRIYIDNQLDPEGNTFHSSIALHEIVHWLQGRFGKLGTCEKSIAAEREAYDIQSRYLVGYGIYRPVGIGLPTMGCE